MSTISRPQVTGCHAFKLNGTWITTDLLRLAGILLRKQGFRMTSSLHATQHDMSEQADELSYTTLTELLYTLVQHHSLSSQHPIFVTSR